MSSTRGRTVRRRLQGVAFLVVLAALLGLSVAFYNKAFTDVATVTLQTDTAGNQLQEASDVKVRGVLVGEVRAVHADLDGATITLGIDPKYLPQIPDNVTARLLPKTLFGERFVSLVPPPSPSAQAPARPVAGRRRGDRPGPHEGRHRAAEGDRRPASAAAGGAAAGPLVHP